VTQSVLSLQDVNILVALIVPEPEHQASALQWFATEAINDGWAIESRTPVS